MRSAVKSELDFLAINFYGSWSRGGWARSGTWVISKRVTSARIHEEHHNSNIDVDIHNLAATMTIPPFETTFAVPMTCEACIKDIKGSLSQLSGTHFANVKLCNYNLRAGINKITANLEDQLVSIEGTAAPSAIVAAIEATGRDAILRGSGKSNSELPSEVAIKF